MLTSSQFPSHFLHPLYLPLSPSLVSLILMSPACSLEPPLLSSHSPTCPLFHCTPAATPAILPTVPASPAASQQCLSAERCRRGPWGTAWRGRVELTRHQSQDGSPAPRRLSLIFSITSLPLLASSWIPGSQSCGSWGRKLLWLGRDQSIPASPSGLSETEGQLVSGSDLLSPEWN